MGALAASRVTVYEAKKYKKKQLTAMIVTFNHCRYIFLPYAVFVEYILNLQKSNLFHCFFESAFRDVGGFFCALLHAFREISFVAYKAVVFLS